MGEVRDESSLNGLFKRDSRLHSFVAFGNGIVVTLSYLIIILKSGLERVGDLSRLCLKEISTPPSPSLGNDVVLISRSAAFC